MAHRRDAVRRAYEDQGLSRQDLAEITGLSPKTITNAMSGDPLSRHKAARIGAVIGWSAEEVLAGERKLDREKDAPDPHVSPKPLPPARPPEERRRPPNKVAQGATA